MGGGTSCAEREGDYLAISAELSGTCGPIEPSIVVFRDVPPATAGSCSGSQDVSPDLCKVTTDAVCKDAPDAKPYSIKGTVAWAADGQTAEGQLNVSWLDPKGAPTCASVYRLTYSRQPDEDTDCGINCEPYTARSCTRDDGGTAGQVCDPGGLAYSKCGDLPWESKPSACPEGTACVARPGGYARGCRALCAPKEGKGCDAGLTRVACQVPATRRALEAGCKLGDEIGVYCCPTDHF